MSLITCIIRVEQSSAGVRYFYLCSVETASRFIRHWMRLTIPLSGVLSSWEMEWTIEYLYWFISSSIDKRLTELRSVHTSVYTFFLKRNSLYIVNDIGNLSPYLLTTLILPYRSFQLIFLLDVAAYVLSTIAYTNFFKVNRCRFWIVHYEDLKDNLSLLMLNILASPRYS